MIEVFGKRIEKVGTTQVKSYTTPSELKELLSSLVYEMQVGGDSALCALPLARPPFLFRFGLLDAVSELPTPAWGRDELRAGEMWNSNSIVAWLLVRSGIDPDAARLPQRGRAPGWHAGLVVARRAG